MFSPELLVLIMQSSNLITLLFPASFLSNVFHIYFPWWAHQNHWLSMRNNTLNNVTFVLESEKMPLASFGYYRGSVPRFVYNFSKAWVTLFNETQFGFIFSPKKIISLMSTERWNQEFVTIQSATSVPLVPPSMNHWVLLSSKQIFPGLSIISDQACLGDLGLSGMPVLGVRGATLLETYRVMKRWLKDMDPPLWHGKFFKDMESSYLMTCFQLKPWGEVTHDSPWVTSHGILPNRGILQI